MRDIVIHDVPPASGDEDGVAARFIVYIVPGNPGLISFYAAFASTLARLLEDTATRHNVSVRICGKSLTGFETESSRNAKRRGSPCVSDGPAGLVETVLAAEADAHDLARDLVGSSSTSAKAPAKVILVGHSVGAYISMELLRRHSVEEDDPADPADPATPLKRTAVAGSILLFPVLTHIARSRSGLLYARFLTLKYLATVVALLVKMVLFCVPPSLLYLLVRLVTRFPPPAAATVTAFLESKHGIKQALYLAGDEMRTILEDRWSCDVWEGCPSGSRPVYMYFGRQDAWVPDDARADLIRTHGSGPGPNGVAKKYAVIDREDIPHAWCIDHSDAVAKNILPWINDIISESLSTDKDGEKETG
ncbi:hypothetical protein SPI_07008 [Niveomyces insectorum RCEF 264]|uniref:Lipid droplet-associated hydrolase n=1 Tax=Niveomyces insectorum RCEF 264 TaxID=1081102 RepID=A0A167QZD3_9HYPO|nr:hypothetical protein SPI_07008 [Niveomyces insectorum RCEF 264]